MPSPLQQFVKKKLEDSGSGRGIVIDATSTPGTRVHRAFTADSDNYDEVFLYATNHDTNPQEIVIEWGGVDDPRDLVPVTVPPRERIQIIDGRLLNGNLDIGVFCPGGSGLVTVDGFANVIEMLG
jgi:hypothetical protein